LDCADTLLLIDSDGKNDGGKMDDGEGQGGEISLIRAVDAKIVN